MNSLFRDVQIHMVLRFFLDQIILLLFNKYILLLVYVSYTKLGPL